eukprot:m.314124 g.314124  ORF g.314124 m.314124 type:complete len:1717 (-) comp16409_c0_seq9:26-5176(-)
MRNLCGGERCALIAIACIIGQAQGCLTEGDMVIWLFAVPRVYNYGEISTQNTSAAWIPAACVNEASAAVAGHPVNYTSATALEINALWIPFFCRAPCINSSTFALPQREQIRYVDFTASIFEDTTLDVNTFSEAPNIEWIEGHNAGITDFRDGFFAPLSRLIFVGFTNNLLTILRNNLFANNTVLRYVSLSNNRISTIEPNALRNTQVGSISLNGNHFSQVPAAGLQGASHSLIQIELSENTITRIAANDFSGMSLVRGLLMARNPVVQVDASAFWDLTALAVAPNVLSPLPELVGLGFWAANNPNDVPFGNRAWRFAAIDVEAWPRECRWTGPMLNNFSCAECTFGYIDVNGVCTFPSFGVRTGYWDPSTIENDPQMGVPDSNGDRVIFLRNQINLDPPATTLDPKRGFVGYSNNDYVGVSYELAFVGDISIGCGGADDVVTGDTSAQTPVFLGLSGTTNIPFDSLRALLWGFSDRPAYLQFEVTTAGNITFDSCDSLYTTSMMVFRGWGDSAVSDVANLVGYDTLTPEMVDGWVHTRFPNLNWSNIEAPWQGGCPASMLTRRKQHFQPGRYTLMIRGIVYGQDLGGTYVMKMQCSDNATTRSVAAQNPGGLFVNPTTGQISGTPKRLGENFTMRLMAIDSSRSSKTTVANWRFSVRNELFGTIPTWTGTAQYNLNRGIAAQYHAQQLHTIAAPRFTREELFISPSNGDFDAIVFLLLVNGSACEDPPEAFVNVVTGAAVFNVTCEGNYTATLKARDDAGFEVVVNEWTFEARVLDTSNAAFGPNGRGCSRGLAVDGKPMDQKFTCDCTDTAFEGDNCEMRSTESSSRQVAETVTFSFVAFAVLVALVLGFSRYQLYRARHMPEDVGDFQDEVLQNFGLGAALLSGKGEIGLMLQVKSAIDHPSKRNLASLILDEVRTVSGLPRYLMQLVKARSAEVRFAEHLPYALLVLPRPPTLKAGAVDDLAAALSKHASLGGFKFGTGDAMVSIIDVSVAVARQLPREIDRHHVTRLNVVGEGNFGEVFKATLRAGTVTLTVAAKSLKINDDGARDSLLREAALMALCEHYNLVHLLGIVTVPRNMPPLLVMEYCEHGTVLDVVRGSCESDIDLHLLLSFCHDVASGLKYLGSRRIVHRDVAARNVLLDSAFTCKLSDFGMSAAVCKGDGDYSSNYVKMPGELPIRWAAIEVLKEGKYSRASDVWAFGVFVHEIMSRGAVPYKEFATLAETTEQVKSGYQLRCPPECPEVIHELVMVPCWRPHPSHRPGFSTIVAVLVELGVAASSGFDQEQVSNITNVLRESSLFVPSTFPTRNGDVQRPCFQNRSTLGVSVLHISQKLLPLVLDRVKPPWVDSQGQLVTPVASATIRHTVSAVVKPVTAGIVCPRDGRPGCAYVDTLTQCDDVGTAHALLSYTWAYKIQSVTLALHRWVNETNRDPQSTYVWICALCMNQQRMPDSVPSETLANEFRSRVVSIGRILPMLEPWHSALYLTRTWCLFELYTAIGEHGKVQIEVILSQEQNDAFLNAMATEGYRSIDRALADIRSENATASREADLEAIRNLVQSTPGGFEQLNTTVRHHLARWFEAQGAIRTAIRMVGRKQIASHPVDKRQVGVVRMQSEQSSGPVSRTQSLQTDFDENLLFDENLRSALESISKERSIDAVKQNMVEINNGPHTRQNVVDVKIVDEKERTSRVELEDRVDYVAFSSGVDALKYNKVTQV